MNRAEHISDIAIIGAGAAGMAAAVAAKQTAPRASVLLLEGQPAVGKKLLATGNGRCNLSNVSAAGHAYHNAPFAAEALRQFGTHSTVEFFASLGLYTYCDSEGRIYPLSNTAASVKETLRLACVRLGVTVCTGEKITSLQKTGGVFLLNGKFRAAKVIVACGGMAAPVHGSDGSGFALLESLGHHIVPPVPALVQLTSENKIIRGFQGLRAQATLTLLVDEAPAGTVRGEVLFTDYGLSGIAAMDAQRLLCASLGKKPCAVELDFLPSFVQTDLRDAIAALIRLDPQRKCKHLLLGFVPKKIGQGFLKCLYLKDDAPCGSLDDETIARLARLMKHFRVAVSGAKGFAQAQVTRGGADVNEFDPQTLESLLAPGLYCAGESLDVDGGCGGFNLQWAFASGRCAGTHAAKNPE